MSGPGFSVQRVYWREAEDAIRAIRYEVFVEEQNVPADLEWDGLDADCVQVLAASDDGEPIGTGRMMHNGRIGRMSVRKPWRGRGVGAALLKALIDIAQEHRFELVVLNAQTQVIDFYARYGFVAEGEVFMEADIPHQRMTRRLVTPR